MYWCSNIYLESAKFPKFFYIFYQKHYTVCHHDNCFHPSNYDSYFFSLCNILVRPRYSIKGFHCLIPHFEGNIPEILAPNMIFAFYKYLIKLREFLLFPKSLRNSDTLVEIQLPYLDWYQACSECGPLSINRRIIVTI